MTAVDGIADTKRQTAESKQLTVIKGVWIRITGPEVQLAGI